MVVSSTIIELGVVLILFSAIIGCYVQVNTKSTETNGRVQKIEDCIEGKMDMLAKEVSALRLDTGIRLTAIETILRLTASEHSLQTVR